MSLLTKQIHRVIVLWANLCRLVLGGVFLFSGFTKAIDPLGFFYKLQDYLTAFGLLKWANEAALLLGGISLSALELAVGIFLLLGIRRIFATSMALLLMIVMTPLTFYLALANPVSDCGCFGDAWVLTNWQTFGKNVVLLAAAVSAVKWRLCLVKLITQKTEWMVSTYTFIFVFVLSFYCLGELPIIDFRPYKIGVNIKEGMEVPEGARPTVYESRFLMKKGGEEREFTLDNYPDSTWTFVEARNVLVEKGYEPPIHDFAMMSVETGEDITDSVLSNPGYTFLLVAHRIEEADDDYIDLINEIYDYSMEHGYDFYALTSSPEADIERWCDMTGAEYPFCQMDDITLKTIVRSNPGLLLLREGIILNKWSDNALPDEYQLTDRLERLPLGRLKQVNNLRTIGYVLLWFIIPLLVVLAIDLIWGRERNRPKPNQMPAASETTDKQQININPLN